MSFDLCICDACKSIRKSKSIDLLRCTDVYMRKSWIVPSQWLCECRILVAACAQRRCCRSVYMSKDCVMSLQCMWLQCMYIDLIKRKTDRFTCITQTCRCAKAELCLCNICVYVVYKLNVWIRRCYCSVCDCAACKSVWKSKSINLLHRTDVYVRKSWVVPSQWLCKCRILVAACAQRRCCRSVYMSKDCVMSLQCMWLRCMYIDLIKRKTDRFTASRRRVDVQKLNRAFAIYVCMLYMSSTCK